MGVLEVESSQDKKKIRLATPININYSQSTHPDLIKCSYCRLNRGESLNLPSSTSFPPACHQPDNMWNDFNHVAPRGITAWIQMKTAGSIKTSSIIQHATCCLRSVWHWIVPLLQQLRWNWHRWRVICLLIFFAACRLILDDIILNICRSWLQHVSDVEAIKESFHRGSLEN